MKYVHTWKVTLRCLRRKSRLQDTTFNDFLDRTLEMRCMQFSSRPANFSDTLMGPLGHDKRVASLIA
jgi:hypothetical protein